MQIKKKNEKDFNHLNVYGNIVKCFAQKATAKMVLKKVMELHTDRLGSNYEIPGFKTNWDEWEKNNKMFHFSTNGNDSYYYDIYDQYKTKGFTYSFPTTNFKSYIKQFEALGFKLKRVEKLEPESSDGVHWKDNGYRMTYSNGLYDLLVLSPKRELPLQLKQATVMFELSKK